MYGPVGGALSRRSERWTAGPARGSRVHRPSPVRGRWRCGGAVVRRRRTRLTPCAGPRRWSVYGRVWRCCRPHARGDWCSTEPTTRAAGRLSCGGSGGCQRTAGAQSGRRRCAATGPGAGVATPSSVIAADEADQLALDLDLIGAEDAGLVVAVGRLQRDRGPLLAQAFEGGFLALDQRHDDLARGGGIG